MCPVDHTGVLGDNPDSRFCGGDEDHDPSEEYEEYLTCSVCGDNGELQSLSQIVVLRNKVANDSFIASSPAVCSKLKCLGC